MDNQPDLSMAPPALQRAVAGWLEDHPEDVVMVPVDSQDALILDSNAESVTWIDPSGCIRTVVGRWVTVKQGEED